MAAMTVTIVCGCDVLRIRPNTQLARYRPLYVVRPNFLIKATDCGTDPEFGTAPATFASVPLAPRVTRAMLLCVKRLTGECILLDVAKDMTMADIKVPQPHSSSNSHSCVRCALVSAPAPCSCFSPHCPFVFRGLDIGSAGVFVTHAAARLC
jgi:hypothetical protein